MHTLFFGIVTALGLTAAAPAGPITTVHWGDNFAIDSYSVSYPWSPSVSTFTIIYSSTSSNAESTLISTLTTTGSTTYSLLASVNIPTLLPVTTTTVVSLGESATTLVYVDDMPPENDPAFTVLSEAVTLARATESTAYPALYTLLAVAGGDWWGNDDILWTATASVGQLIPGGAGGKTVTLTAATPSYNVYGTMYIVETSVSPMSTTSTTSTSQTAASKTVTTGITTTTPMTVVTIGSPNPMVLTIPVFD